MKIGIIGAGPAGLSCALKLVESGHEVDVFEADSAVGGMTKSFALWGQQVDLGPHRFFSMDEKVNQFWKEQVGEAYIQIDRLTRIYYKKKFFLYPVRALNALSNLGILEAIGCVFSYVKALFHRNRGKETTFEEWVSNQFGYKLYSIFFKAYSEKLWGISCKDLDADFARQRIKGLNMLEVIKSALIPAAGRKHKTLVDCFAYPKMGGGVPYERIKDKIEAAGSHVYLNTPVAGIVTKNRQAKGIRMADGTVREYDYVVSTAPFTEMVCSIEELPEEIHKLSKQLTYRNTTLVYLEVDRRDIFRDNWIYVHDTTVQSGRITNFYNWSPYMRQGHEASILALEYWSYDQDAFWGYDDETLIGIAKEDMVKTELVKVSEIKNGFVYRMHRSYPVYDTGYQEKLNKISAVVDEIEGLAFIGRNGSFKYNNQDHSILMGLLAAENIISGTKKNCLWHVNTDYDYQEGNSSLIHKEDLPGEGK